MTMEFLKVAYNVLKEANRLDLAEKILNLREELIDLKEEKLRLLEENNDLKEKLTLKSKITFDKGVCWIIDDEMKPDKSNTPICPTCWQEDGIVKRINPEYFGRNLGINCRKKGHGVFTIR